MNQSADFVEDNDDIPSDVDFSKGVRGKFYRPELNLNLPVYLDEQVQQFLAIIAVRKGLQISDIANELLKKDIAMFESFNP
jgi:hypothetical protein